MIRNIKLYPNAKGKPDITGYNAIINAIREKKISVVEISAIPLIINISMNHIDIFFGLEEYSFARIYSIEKAFPPELLEDEKKEIIRQRCYRITFKNPRNDENLYSGFIILNKNQNLTIKLFRFIRWFRYKENLLWLINILVLLLNIIISCYKCC